MEILFIEDSLPDARLAIEALRQGQVVHRLTLMRDGGEALEFLQQHGKYAHAPRPDLILLDLNLPKLTGRELLVEIRGRPALCAIPVVVMTSSERHQDDLRAQGLEVEGFMVKPVELDKFLLLVKQLKKYWLADVILPQETA